MLEDASDCFVCGQLCDQDSLYCSEECRLLDPPPPVNDVYYYRNKGSRSNGASSSRLDLALEPDVDVPALLYSFPPPPGRTPSLSSSPTSSILTMPSAFDDDSAPSPIANTSLESLPHSPYIRPNASRSHSQIAFDLYSKPALVSLSPELSSRPRPFTGLRFSRKPAATNNSARSAQLHRRACSNGNIPSSHIVLASSPSPPPPSAVEPPLTPSPAKHSKKHSRASLPAYFPLLATPVTPQPRSPSGEKGLRALMRAQLHIGSPSERKFLASLPRLSHRNPPPDHQPSSPEESRGADIYTAAATPTPRGRARHNPDASLYDAPRRSYEPESVESRSGRLSWSPPSSAVAPTLDREPFEHLTNGRRGRSRNPRSVCESSSNY
ncbi:hypothetical protein BOTBODRAFT_228611 [Botryobasidium botryosum FD-172 SS1]|uniref:Uncharacterized protein n=1 Tax=Botryobasidium botryosum (strain FD-172 SS1) TaxID=930990 RepID=A0A067LXJ8_BOTB1|nr:hypothetical protein BOTBODRAFT_228611 [Botryobasidium botryosum FD-172 SS1]